MKTCLAGGCGQKVLCKGLCSRHYYRNKRGGDITQKSAKEKNLAERFWEKVEIVDDQDCWTWRGCKDESGYGTLRNGQMHKAHRISWILHHGSIPEKMHICHTCDNPSCVNPSHLFVGTAFDNMADMVKKGRHKTGNNCKLTDEQVDSIRSLKGILTHRVLASKFNVSKSAITAILTGRNWPKGE